MVIKRLTLSESPTLVWALHWVTATHRPVVVDDIIIRRFVLVAVFTTELAYIHLHFYIPNTKDNYQFTSVLKLDTNNSDVKTSVA
jgi:hypothetical protein